MAQLVAKKHFVSSTNRENLVRLLPAELVIGAPS